MTRTYTLDFDGLDGISEIEDAKFSSDNVENPTIPSGLRKTDINQISTANTNIRMRVAAGCVGIALVAYLGVRLLPNNNSGIDAGLIEGVKNTESIEKSNELSVTPDQSADASLSAISSSKMHDNDSVSEPKLLPQVASSTARLADNYNRSVTVDMAQTKTAMTTEKTDLPRLNRVPPEPTDIVRGQFPVTLESQVAVAGKSNASPSSDPKKDKLVIPFRFNIATPNHWSTPILNQLQDLVNRCPSTIQIVGHTCSLGPYLANLDIGQARAESLKQILIKLGADANHIETSSAGEKQPIASNTTATGRALNRRVVIDCRINTEDRENI